MKKYIFLIFLMLFVANMFDLYGKKGGLTADNLYESTNQLIQMTEHLQASELSFEIHLTSSKAAYKSGETPEVTAIMTNNNDFTIALMNKFSPTKDFFDIDIEYKHPEKDVYERQQPELHIKTLYTLSADEMWLWLQPGESFEVPIEIDDKIREKGDYKITIEYTRKILIKKQTEVPYYTEKFKWQSTQLEVKMK